MIKQLTIVILTSNEEENIVAVINNARKLTNNVLVLDCGSTDATVVLAEQAGAQVAFRAWRGDFAAQRNYALSLVTTEWVLYLDADERMDETLLAVIEQAVTANADNCYEMRRYTTAFNTEFNHGPLAPDLVLRLFKVKHGHWENPVHESLVCNDKKVRLNGVLKHYTYVTWEQWVNKMDKYSTIWAHNAFQKGKKTSLSSVLVHGIGAFVKMYFFKAGILDGAWGLIMCFNNSFYVMQKYLKLYNMQNNY